MSVIVANHARSARWVVQEVGGCWIAGFTPPAGITGPMSAALASHLAAVALFRKPSTGFLQVIRGDAPPITSGHLYAVNRSSRLATPEIAQVESRKIHD
jgi:cutinase